MLEIMKKIIRYFLYAAFIFISYNCNKDYNSKSQNAVGGTGAGGSTARFTINGNYLYTVDHTGLKTFDITNPLAPSYKGKKELGLNIETIFPYKDKLFIGSSTTMYIYSVTTPDNPTLIATAHYQIRMACDPVVANETVAYATLRAAGPCGGGQSRLVVYNIKNTSSPVLMKTINLSNPYGLGMQGNVLYVCESNGLQVFDITTQYSPKLETTVTGDRFFDVIPYGDILIAQVQDGMALYDIATNPLAPTLIAKINN